MARAPKKPKLKSYPKTPRASASLTVMKRYKEKCREVDRHNAAKVSEYNKKINEIKLARKMHSGIGGVRPKKVYKFATL